jgi:hypothetical protein
VILGGRAMSGVSEWLLINIAIGLGVVKRGGSIGLPFRGLSEERPTITA